MNNRPFMKYDKFGAYHWRWYKSNKFSYRDYAELTLSYFNNSGTLLDVGCGDGLMTYLIANKGFIVTGIDTNIKAIELGKVMITKKLRKKYFLDYVKHLLLGDVKNFLEHNGVRLLNLSAYDLTEEIKYDYSICLEVIEHVPEPKELIEKIMNITQKFLIISTPNGEFCEPDIEDYQFWKPNEFIKFFGKNRAELLNVSKDRIFAKIYNKNFER